MISVTDCASWNAGPAACHMRGDPGNTGFEQFMETAPGRVRVLDLVKTFPVRFRCAPI